MAKETKTAYTVDRQDSSRRGTSGVADAGGEPDEQVRHEAHRQRKSGDNTFFPSSPFSGQSRWGGVMLPATLLRALMSWTLMLHYIRNYSNVTCL